MLKNSGKKSDSSLKIWKIFIRDFLVSFTRDFFVNKFSMVVVSEREFFYKRKESKKERKKERNFDQANGEV